MLKVCYVGVSATHDKDGMMFVTSENVPYFSAVVQSGDWDAVLELLKRSLEVNIGPVHNVHFIEDPRNYAPDSGWGAGPIPPAHVVAEVAQERVRSR